MSLDVLSTHPRKTPTILQLATLPPYPIATPRFPTCCIIRYFRYNIIYSILMIFNDNTTMIRYGRRLVTLVGHHTDYAILTRPFDRHGTETFYTRTRILHWHTHTHT